MKSASRQISITRVSPDGWEAAEGEVIVETPVALTVNGEAWLTFMCTPVDLEQMAVGFLFNEGVIDSIDEIADVRLCQTGDNIDVWLTHSAEKPKTWRRTSGCTGGVTAFQGEVALNNVPNGLTLPAHRVGDLISQLFDSQQLYRAAGGVHTSAVSDGEKIIQIAEDIGRHNTLDKLAGHLLKNDVSLPHRVILTTGRISSEMLQKARRMGAWIVISRTSPSSLSIELAEAAGITLIGYARRNRFIIYAHPERILATSEMTQQTQPAIQVMRR